jgi:hypothetical protein
MAKIRLLTLEDWFLQLPPSRDALEQEAQKRVYLVLAGRISVTTAFAARPGNLRQALVGRMRKLVHECPELAGLATGPARRTATLYHELLRLLN